MNWSISSGSLPPGLTLNASTGVISGTPTVAGTYNFQITVTNDSGNAGIGTYSVTIIAAALQYTLTINPNSLSSGQVGVAYGPVTLSAS